MSQQKDEFEKLITRKINQLNHEINRVKEENLELHKTVRDLSERLEQFESAWRQLSKGDFTLLEEITDPSFQAKSQGMIVDLEAYKGISKSLSEPIIIGPFRVIYEADEFLCVHRFSKSRNAEIFDASITAVSYKDQKIIFQESRREELDYDPSEGQDWNWEDYE